LTASLPLTALLLCLAATPVAQTQNAGAANAGPQHFSHVTFTAPAGWTRQDTGGWAILVPPGLAPGQSVSIGISPGGQSNKPLVQEFQQMLQASAQGLTTVQMGAPGEGNDRQGHPMIQQMDVLKDARGNQYVRLYMAWRNGDRFESLVFSLSDPNLVPKYLPMLQKMTDGMTFDGAPPPPAAVAAALPPPQAGKHGVDGFYCSSEIDYGGGGHLICKFYWFRPDGTLYLASRDPMSVARGARFSDLQVSDPDHMGTYGINGDKITIRWTGQLEPRTMSWSGDQMDGGVLEPVHSFAPGTRLEGTWGSDMSISGPGFSGAFSSSNWTFHADGTVTNDSFSGVDARGGVAGSSGTSRGLYKLSGTELTITLAGATQTYPVLSIGKGAVPRILFLDGHILSKR
jgi:hypothetical protein